MRLWTRESEQSDSLSGQMVGEIASGRQKGSKMEIKLRDEFIKLGQALKAAGLVESGVDAKFAIQDGLVKVNGAVETQRGKKLYDGDEIQYDGETVTITK